MSFQPITGVINPATTDNWSGYGDEFLNFLYEKVIELQPTTVLEFGTGWGYTTIAFAQGIRDSEKFDGMVYSYDHFIDDYDGGWTNNEPSVENNLRMFDVDQYVRLQKIDVFEWLENTFHFDLSFIDLHNNGEILNKVFNHNFIKTSVLAGSEVIFCGGSEFRDEINIKRNERPITSVDCEIECVYGGPTMEYPKGMKSCIARIVGY